MMNLFGILKMQSKSKGHTIFRGEYHKRQLMQEPDYPFINGLYQDLCKRWLKYLRENKLKYLSRYNDNFVKHLQKKLQQCNKWWGIH